MVVGGVADAALAVDEDEEPAPAAPIADESESEERPLFRSLSALVDRLAADEDLFTPLNEADDAPPPAAQEPVSEGAPTLFKLQRRNDGLEVTVTPGKRPKPRQQQPALER